MIKIIIVLLFMMFYCIAFAVPSNTSIPIDKNFVNKRTLDPESYSEDMLIVYLRSIDKISEQKNRDKTVYLNEQLPQYEKIDKIINENPDEAYKKIKDNKNDTTVIKSFFSPKSIASANLFSKAFDENLIDINDFINYFYQYVDLFNDSWVLLISKYSASLSKSDNKYAAMLLYKIGVNKDGNRLILENRIFTENDLNALKTLFFQVLPYGETGEVNITSDNYMLYRQLITKCDNQELLAFCVEYAIAIHDYSSAEELCDKNLNIPYKAFENIKDETNYPSDLILYRARKKILNIMFYKLKNEFAFRRINYLCNIDNIQRVQHEGEIEWIRYSDAAPGRLDINLADSLIGIIKYEYLKSIRDNRKNKVEKGGKDEK
jgi:hypothetical protein